MAVYGAACIVQHVGYAMLKLVMTFCVAAPGGVLKPDAYAKRERDDNKPCRILARQSLAPASMSSMALSEMPEAAALLSVWRKRLTCSARGRACQRLTLSSVGVVEGVILSVIVFLSLKIS